MARGKDSKKGLTPLRVIPSQSPLNQAETAAINSTVITQDESTRGYNNPTVVPPTTDAPQAYVVLPPKGIVIGSPEVFNVSVSGNGSSATYTSTNYHGMTTSDIVVIGNFSSSGGFNGTYNINSYTGKTFTVPSTATGSEVSGSARNNKNNCGTILSTSNGATSVDVYVTFEEVLNAADYRLEVIKID